MELWNINDEHQISNAFLGTQCMFDPVIELEIV